MTSKPKNNQKIRLRIERLGIHGEGIGHWHGFTLFVHGPLPGETIQACVTEVKKNYGQAKLIKIDAPSPSRVTPPCPVFRKCGGCQVMHLKYEEQLHMKRQRVIDAFERIGKFKNPQVTSCIPSPDPLHYRNKIQIVHVDSKLGFYARSSHDLVAVEQCYIHSPIGEEVFQKLRQLITKEMTTLRYIIIKSAIHTGEVLVVFVTSCPDDRFYSLAKELMHACPSVKGVIQNNNNSDGNTVFGKEFHQLAGQPSITEILCGLKFNISASSFFQVNPKQAEHMYNKAIEYCGLTGSERVLDAYCGVGTLTLISSQNAKEVIGIEYLPEAVQDARANAELNNIKNVSFICGTAETQKIDNVDVIILNPPRKGCEPSLLENITSRTVVYISCDPATLARDVAILFKKGYQIEAIQPFDMFPQTAHVETVVKLIKK